MRDPSRGDRMTAPLEGVRVLEVANWLAAPAAAALMADLGAEVIKVEPPEGDAFRGFQMSSLGYQYPFAGNYGFELDNRGKRSISVALDKPGGPELVKRLARDADVFITNLVQTRRERYGLGFEDVRAVNPRLVYASFSGYGVRGPDRGRPGFDFAAFWARSGLMSLLGEPPSPPPLCRGGQGDHTTALNILAAVLAALRLRDRSGEGQHVEVTLQGTGIWTLAGDVQAALVSRENPSRHQRTQPANPIWNSYQAKDGLWVLLVMPMPDPYWPKFCAAIDKPEWAADPRYDSLAKRRAHSVELTKQVDAIFATRTRAEWAQRLDAQSLIWAPVATLTDVIDDPQVHEMGWFAPIDSPTLGKFETLGTPFKLYGADVGPRGPAPAAGEHTFEVLSAAGLTDDELAKLAADGVIG
jgi:crotonobetainyl-CoA:carnitine CoA-transferase CaiB-like acyl-CoA transferase